MAVYFFFIYFIPSILRKYPDAGLYARLPRCISWPAEQILKAFGPGAVIASREPEVAYRSKGYWIGLPYGTPEEIVEWLYLGGANYLLLHDVVPIPEEEKIFWTDPKELHKQFPELEVVADFNLTQTIRVW